MTTTTVRPWTLAKFRQTILDCYLEKLRMDSDSTDNTVTQLTPFVCTFFFNKYGVKRLVQVRQREPGRVPRWLYQGVTVRASAVNANVLACPTVAP